jgi:putative NADPH-quinone reductase
MRLLLVLAHPLEQSFSAAVARAARDALAAGGHEVDWLDLYAEGFDPRLTAAERRSYFDDPYDASAVAPLVERLTAADGLVLVFPLWWFDFPAILKGWFDRVFAPGIAFEHGAGPGGIARKLTNIRLLCALTTAGSPWWMVRLVMGDPVRRLLRRGIATMCAKDVRFQMLTLYDLDHAKAAKREAHVEKVKRLMARL